MRAGNDPVAARAGEALHQLANGRLLAVDDIDHELEAARDSARARCVDEIPGNRAIEIVAGEVEAHHLTQLRQGEFGLDQLVEFVLKSIGFSLRAADEGADAGQDLDLVGTAIEGAGLALDVGIERRRRLQCLMRRENCLREPGGERAAVVGGAGLYVDRPSLRRPRDVQRATNAKMLADMVERVDLAGVGEDARSRIVDERVILPAIPQPGDHVEIFAGALIALVVRGCSGNPKFCAACCAPVVTMFQPARPRLRWSRDANSRARLYGSV